MWLNRLLWSASLAYHLRGQAGFPFQPLATIRRTQARRVRHMVAHAYATVPYYRETLHRRGLRPSDFRGADDLIKLPLLERNQLQRDPEYFVSTAQPLDRYLRLRSGSSSGAPCTVYHDIAGIVQNAAHGERERSILTRLIGKALRYRETVVASPLGTPYKVQQFLLKHALLPRRARIERQYISLAEPPEQAARLIAAFKPDLIQSYGSYFELLFAHLQASGEPFHRPKAITYSSDGLSDHARRLITRRFAIPVFSTYQAIEAFKIGFECEQHLGLHLNCDLYPIRIIDGEGRMLPTGASGDVVVSNLVNGATVLLNYRLGDIARLLPDRCPCGRSLPLLSFPEGRSDDIIELPSGHLLHAQAVNALFRDEQELWQYQIVQASEARLTIAMVPGARCDREQTRARVAAKVAQVLGPEVAVDIAFVDAVERTASGKARAVISSRGRARLSLAAGREMER